MRPGTGRSPRRRSAAGALGSPNSGALHRRGWLAASGPQGHGPQAHEPLLKLVSSINNRDCISGDLACILKLENDLGDFYMGYICNFLVLQSEKYIMKLLFL